MKIGALIDIPTKNGKVIKVQTACIEVAANRHSEVGWYADVKINAILPKGRKAHTLSHTVSYQAICLMPLFGYAQWQHVDPAVYLEFLRSIPVTSSKLFPVELTPEVMSAARKSVEEVCSCPAVTKSLSEVA